MKKSILVLALFAMIGALSAQTQKGSVFLGATTNLSGGFADANLLQGIMPSNQLSIGFGKTVEKYGNEKYTSSWNAINISPTGGYFVANGLMLGASAGLMLLGSKDEGDTEENRATILAITPMVRYYFKQSGKMRPYAEVRGGILNVSYNDETDPYDATLFGGKVGGAIFIGDRTSLDIFIDYNSSSSKDQNDFVGDIKTTSSVFGVGAGFSYFLK